MAQRLSRFLPKMFTTVAGAMQTGIIAADINKSNQKQRDTTAKTSRSSPSKSPNKTMTGGAGSKRRRSVRRNRKRCSTRRAQH